MVGMNHLSPVLRLLMDLEAAVERGEAVVQALRDIQSRDAEPRSELERAIGVWLSEVTANWERGLPARNLRAPGDLCQQLSEVLDEAWRGASVLRQLSELRAYAEEQAEADLENFVQALPLKSLIPLLLFQLPSLMLVLLWPILQKLVRDLA
ncbi:MAG TPA: hypothetical protein PLZ57_14720 [Pseudobdellovibrionaceae bacterium]|nr:hypothetical protein [Pseudobdellovibrionaceae bacterium]